MRTSSRTVSRRTVERIKRSRRFRVINPACSRFSRWCDRVGPGSFSAAWISFAGTGSTARTRWKKTRRRSMCAKAFRASTCSGKALMALALGGHASAFEGLAGGQQSASFFDFILSLFRNYGKSNRPPGLLELIWNHGVMERSQTLIATFPTFRDHPSPSPLTACMVTDQVIMHDPEGSNGSVVRSSGRIRPSPQRYFTLADDECAAPVALSDRHLGVGPRSFPGILPSQWPTTLDRRCPCAQVSVMPP